MCSISLVCRSFAALSLASKSFLKSESVMWDRSGENLSDSTVVFMLILYLLRYGLQVSFERLFSDNV